MTERTKHFIMGRKWFWSTLVSKSDPTWSVSCILKLVLVPTNCLNMPLCQVCDWGSHRHCLLVCRHYGTQHKALALEKDGCWALHAQRDSHTFSVNLQRSCSPQQTSRMQARHQTFFWDVGTPKIDQLVRYNPICPPQEQVSFNTWTTTWWDKETGSVSCRVQFHFRLPKHQLTPGWSCIVFPRCMLDSKQAMLSAIQVNQQRTCLWVVLVLTGNDSVLEPRIRTTRVPTADEIPGVLQSGRKLWQSARLRLSTLQPLVSFAPQQTRRSLSR